MICGEMLIVVNSDHLLPMKAIEPLPCLQAPMPFDLQVYSLPHD